jgi:hypothetical protein
MQRLMFTSEALRPFDLAASPAKSKKSLLRVLCDSVVRSFFSTPMN